MRSFYQIFGAVLLVISAIGFFAAGVIGLIKESKCPVVIEREVDPSKGE